MKISGRQIHFFKMPCASVPGLDAACATQVREHLPASRGDLSGYASGSMNCTIETKFQSNLALGYFKSCAAFVLGWPWDNVGVGLDNLNIRLARHLLFHSQLTFYPISWLSLTISLCSEPTENTTSSHITPKQYSLNYALGDSSHTLTSILLDALVANFIVAAISIIAGSSNVKGTMMAIVFPCSSYGNTVNEAMPLPSHMIIQLVYRSNLWNKYTIYCKFQVLSSLLTHFLLSQSMRFSTQDEYM